MKSASALAILAAAGLYGVNPASAADLGGDCCADLEERVAELEATTARKGTRKVSVTISGQISQQLMFWDDGVASDVYVSGPTQSNSRWRITGSGKISPEMSAGFIYEFEAFGSQSSAQNQSNGAGPNNTQGVGNPTQTSNVFGDDAGSGHNLREALAWVEHSRLGRVTIGHGSSAANNVILVDLAGKGMGSTADVRLISSGFNIMRGDGTSTGRTHGNFFQGGSGDWLNERVEHIAYRTPTIAGFTLGASFGEDNYWDVALRYAGEFNGIRIAGAIGYSVRSEFNRTLGVVNGAAALVPGGFGCAFNCDKELKQLAGSLSIRHMPTGLFFTGAAGDRETNNHEFVTLTTTANPDGSQTANGVLASTRSFDSSFFYLSGGIARNFFGFGDTVLFGEYSEWKGAGADVVAAILPSDKLKHWGVGVVQHVDASALEFWLTYKNYAVDSPGVCLAAGCEDLHLILAGTRIRF